MTILKSPVVYINHTYTLTPAEWTRCKLFAKHSLDESADHYLSIGAPTEHKIIQDISVGKAAEIAAFRLLSPTFPNLSHPDFTIYSKSQKSWDPDLKTRHLNIHVKATQNKDEPSWLFHKNDEAILPHNTGSNIASLFVISFPTLFKPPKATMLYLINLSEYNKWRLPYSYSQRTRKIAIYEEDL